MKRLKDWHIIVLLGITIVLYARIFMKNDSSASPALTREMEETFEQFASELEEENRQILDHILRLKNGYETETARLAGRLERLEQQVDALVAAESKEIAPPNATARSEESAPRIAAPVIRHATVPLVHKNDSAEKVEFDGAVQPTRIEESSPAPRSVKERYDQLFRWYDEGKSIDWISKKSGMQVGEIQLILKLARQEEASRG